MQTQQNLPPSGHVDYDRNPTHARSSSRLPALHPPRHSLATTPGTSRNSSLQQVWADDYYADDHDPDPPVSLSFDDDIPSLPPAAHSSRGHRRALTDLLPFRPNSTSPERAAAGQTLDMPLTGDRRGASDNTVGRAAGLASWFSGSSAPVPLGVPVCDKDLPPPPPDSSRGSSPDRTGTVRKRPALQSVTSTDTMDSTPTKGQKSMFNFFSSPKTPSTIQLPADMMNDDEFLSLNVSEALFPQGTPQDSFSPAAFKNLQAHAEGLLIKLQTAYKLRTRSLHELRDEKSAVEEELEEASTRAKSLKSQLDHMAESFTERDTRIAALEAELAREKKARADERQARIKSIALIKANAQKAGSYEEPDEDLGIASKRWRVSADMSTEGESDVESESVFSRSRSPTDTTNSLSTMDSTPELGQAEFVRVAPIITTNTSQRPPPPQTQQKSTFQKLLGISQNSPADKYGGIGLGNGDGCSNCRGKDASVAWDTVGMLRMENRCLKEQIGQIGEGVDEALDCIRDIESAGRHPLHV